MTPQERTSNFLEKYKELVKEFDVDFANYPMFVPNKEGKWEVVVQSTPIDIKDRPTPSPFVPEK